MDLEQLVGVLAEVFGIFVAIVGGGFALVKITGKRAYDAGQHAKDHEAIDESLDSAHEKIREHDDEISELKAESRETRAVMKGIREDVRWIREIMTARAGVD
jgi:hypothetical protein